MRIYQIELTGRQPLLMHQDNIDWADFMDSWKNDPANKKVSKAGDDRTPAWRWIGCCYHDETDLAIPAANIMRCLMEGGAMVPVPGGRSGKTYKSQTQSGMHCVEAEWKLYINGRTIPYRDIEALKRFGDFAEHRRQVAEMGFDLMVKRAKVGTSKHIRVRPSFRTGWVLRGSLRVWDDQITTDVLRSILAYAGNYKGLGDWRPGGRTPGPYGVFSAEVSE